MKKALKVFIILILPVLLLTGCVGDKLVYEDARVKVTFEVMGDYKLVMKKEYFRTSREEAMILDSKFKIGIEFNNDLADKNIKFDKFMNDYKKEKDFKKVKYSDMNGFSIYTPDYLRYEVYLQVNDKLILRLNIYSPNDNKKATTKVLESEEVQDILKHITVKVK